MNSNAQSVIHSALRGRKVLVVGGDRREEALARLRVAFELADVIHCPTRKSDASPRCFQSHLQQPGIALVVWVMGLSRTHHGEHLHRLCRELGIPWVDCFRIPHPNALAARLEALRLVDALLRQHDLVVAPARLRRQQIGGGA